MTIAQDKQLASLWRRGLENPEALDADETMQLWMLMGQYCNAWLVMHQLHEDGQLAMNQWHVVVNDIAAILCSEGGARSGKSAGVLSTLDLRSSSTPCRQIANNPTICSPANGIAALD